ncbi:2580_t:CDS:1, partial [Ambispora leptoticha]
MSLFNAAILAITKEVVQPYEEYVHKKKYEQEREQNNLIYPHYDGIISFDTLHKSLLVWGKLGDVDTEIQDDKTIHKESNMINDANNSSQSVQYNNLLEGKQSLRHHPLIYVKTLSGQILNLNPQLLDRVEKVKELIREKIAIPVEHQRLIFQGRTLANYKSLIEYEVTEKSTLYLFLSLHGGCKPSVLSLDTTHLDPRFDRDLSNVFDSNDEKFMRGNYRYKRPCGWNRKALKVLNKYGSNNAWLGPYSVNNRYNSYDNEWPVSYHGTDKSNCNSIAKEGYKLSKGKRFAYGHGIYSTPDINVAAGYALKFSHENERYCIVFQNRVNPTTLIKISSANTGCGEYWISPNDDDIRPYGICIKK